MKQLPIPVIANNFEVRRKLDTFKSDAIAFVDFDHKAHLFQADTLLIVEPYEVKNNLVNIHTIWKKYLLKQGLEKQLIIAGFEQNENPNYVNVLSLKTDLEKAVQNSKYISDDCQYPINYDDITEKLKVFLKGHGEKSLSKEFTAVLMKIKNMKSAIERTISMPYTYVKKKSYSKAKHDWKIFTAKWKDYKEYFDNCPFYEEKIAIQQNVDLLNPFFECDPTQKIFKEIDCLERVELINEQLNKMEKYVFDS